VQGQRPVLVQPAKTQAPATTRLLGCNTRLELGFERPLGQLQFVDRGNSPRCLPLVGAIKLQRLCQFNGFTQRVAGDNMPFQQANEILLLIRPPPDIRPANADGDRARANIDRSLTLKFLKNIGRQPETRLC
jgi:hypothetical protein